ncbi:MAG: hypothetical protein K6D95_04725 [Treponema sp.]|nr:hypothetical protein [Treponema sp.]
MKKEEISEKKEEMKNRISLALKDPILQQGFEIICKENAELKRDKEQLTEATKELQRKYKKLLDFATERTECCDVCPLTDTCINEEGTCPYAGILKENEEKVTREWIEQFICKE